MEKVTAFKATDGSLFKTEVECQDYEASLLWMERIEEFAASKKCPYPSGAQLGMMRKNIVAWERFKAMSKAVGGGMETIASWEQFKAGV